MKKLMTIVGGIALSFSLHAGSYIWGFGSGEYYDHNGDLYENGTAFLYLGTVTASSSAFDTSAATLITSGSYDGAWYSYGNVDMDNLSSNDNISSTTGQEYTLILLEDSSVASLDNYEGYYTLVTGTSTINEIPGATVVKYADLVNYDVVTTSSQMAAAPTPPGPGPDPAPEPTSGLLVLLGMAGLALRRKLA